MIGAAILLRPVAQSAAPNLACAHCGAPLPEGATERFCCAGCASANAIISAAGLGSFYERLERSRGHRPELLDTDFVVHARMVGTAEAELDLLLDGLDCAACVWLIESLLARNRNVRHARVNLSTRRLSLRWRGTVQDANAYAGLVAALGFRLAPYRIVAANAQDDRATRELLRCMAVAGFAAANVMLLSVAIWSGSDGSMGDATRTLFHWLSAAIALPAIVYAGQPFFRSAFNALKAGHTNMDVPISIGVILASVISLHETTVGQSHAYFDSAITLLFFLLFGRYLDRRARGRARQAVSNLLALSGGTARVLGPDGTTVSRRADQLCVGDVLVVAAGDRLAADGGVIEGSSALDAALVNGESVPVAVEPGSKVFAGMINVGAPIRVRVSAVGERTLLSEIIRLVEAGERGRARFVALADRVARSYAPIVHATALLTFLGWYFLGGVPWDRALLIATSVLIITCPCALALAVPVVHVVASSRLLRAGVLVLRPTALERLASVDHVVLDKTGTVTIGRPELVGGSEDADALRVAAGIAASSRHPLAQALVRASPAVAVAEGTVEHPGGGLQHGNVRLGSARFCSIESSPDDGRSELWLTRPDCRPVRFTFSDRLRRDAVDVVHELTADGLEVELLSGDRRGAVQRVAAIIGVRWQAELSPAGKAQSVADLRNSGKRVLMIGDGLNDAPSLASASASMSPATAVEATQNVADAVFQGVSLMPVVEALRVARRADRLARQNLAIALLYNLVAVPLAIFGYVTPLIAALAMSCSSLLVIGNALRLGTFRQPKSTAETR